MASPTAPPEDPTDVVGRRAAAFLIDVVLLGVVGLVLFAALRYRSYTGVQVDACTALRKTAGNPLCLKVGSRVFLWHVGALKTAALVTVFLAFIDGVVLQSFTGASVGKICMRMSVVNEEGRTPRPLRMFGRWALLLGDVGFFFIGGFMAAATHPHRRIGDFAFGTFVVARRSVGRPVAADAATRADALAVGVPANWSAPPAPAGAKTPLATGAGASPQLHTPPGTAPTTPGEWGAVARPAPVVRSPQWATPPPTESDTPPAVIESSSPPKWAAPPVAPPEPDAESEPETETETAEQTEPETAAVEADAPAGAEADPEAEAEPELSEWSPVASSRRNRGAKAPAKATKDASWWDAALSSGDADNDTEG